MISPAEACVFKDSSTVEVLRNKSCMIGLTNKRMLRFPSFIILNNTLTRTIKDISQDFLVWLLLTHASQNP
jgi:hypothetical protein